MLSLLLSLVTASAFAQPTVLADSVIARSSFRFSRPSVVRMPVQTCNSKGKVRAVQVSVVEGSLDLRSMDAHYLAGGRQRLATKLRLEQGKPSNWIAFTNKENPCLTRLEMSVGATNGGRATVEVIGRWEQ